MKQTKLNIFATSKLSFFIAIPSQGKKQITHMMQLSKK